MPPAGNLDACSIMVADTSATPRSSASSSNSTATTARMRTDPYATPDHFHVLIDFIRRSASGF